MPTIFAMDFDMTIAVPQLFEIHSTEDGIKKVEPYNLQELLKIMKYLTTHHNCHFFLCSLRCVASRYFMQNAPKQRPADDHTKTTFFQYRKNMHAFIQANIPYIDVTTSKQMYRGFRKYPPIIWELEHKNDMLDLIKQKSSEMLKTDIPEKDIVLVDDRTDYQSKFEQYQRNFGFIHADPYDETRNPNGRNSYLLHMLIAGCDSKQKTPPVPYCSFFKPAQVQPPMTETDIKNLEQTALKKLSEIPEITDQFIQEYIDPLKAAYGYTIEPHNRLQLT